VKKFLTLFFALFTVAVAEEPTNQMPAPTNQPTMQSSTSEEGLSKKMDSLQQEMQRLQESVDQKQKELSELKKQMQTLPEEKTIKDDYLPPEYVAPEKSSLHVPVTNAIPNVPPVTDAIPNEINPPSAEVPTIAAEKKSPLVSPMDEKTISTTTVVNSKDQSTMYNSAFELVKSRRYTEAIASMRAYLQKYSTGQYAANAHYWLGQLFMVSGENDNAIIEFSEVVKSFATSAKAPDSMLTLGSLAYTQSQWKEARDWWEDVIKKYPTSAAAEIAKNYLLQLDKEGN
jgi:tol-pal system protein YbgF